MLLMIYSTQLEMLNNMQELQVTIRFRVEHKPNTEFHLKNLITLNGLKVSTKDIVEEDGRLILYV